DVRSHPMENSACPVGYVQTIGATAQAARSVARRRRGCGCAPLRCQACREPGESAVRRSRMMLRLLASSLILLGMAGLVSAQPPNARIGEAVPRDVREMYDKGLQYLVKTQTDKGDWQGGQSGPGVTGLGLMVFLASGEDPNFGLYSNNVRKAVRSIV